jgi:DNA-binding response OmpR family regulator
MKILVAEDDSVTRRLLAMTLERFGWDVTTAEDGNVAWRILETETGANAPQLLVLDWMMPGLEGIEICRRLRADPRFERVYVILHTSRIGKQDLSDALAAGANDYIAKPFDPVELEARARAGERMLKLQSSLADRVAELEHALDHVRALQGLLPICSYCKKIRNEANYWEQVDSYLTSHLDLEITHSICPDCVKRMEKELEESPV